MKPIFDAVVKAVVDFSALEPVAFVAFVWTILFMMWVTLQTIIVMILSRKTTVDRVADLIKENVVKPDTVETSKPVDKNLN